MELKDQTCSIEQAKKLKELGIINTNPIVAFKFISSGWEPFVIEENKTYDIVSFTVAELGVMLPSETYTQRTGSEDSEYANWEWVDDGNQKGMGMFNTEAQSKADHLIFLIQNKLVTPEECNNRLNQ